jgi:hypothetical protein
MTATNLADLEMKRREPPPFAVPPATLAGAYLCRHYHINPKIADLVASLAGLGPDRRAA